MGGAPIPKWDSIRFEPWPYFSGLQAATFPDAPGKHTWPSANQRVNRACDPRLVAEDGRGAN